MAAATFDIETGDFEAERHIFDMWRWVNTQLTAMGATPDFDSIYFSQSGGNVKKLIEEALPVAFLGLNFVKPMVEVYVRCLTGNQPYDATLRVEGFSSFDIKVEVTTTETEETVFARQQLAANGIVHRPAKFVRTAQGKVPLPVEMSDMAEQYDEWKCVALDRAEKKVNSGKYDPNTAILVRVDNWSPMPIKFRHELIAETKNRLRGSLSCVHGIYYLHGRNIDEVSIRSV